MLHSRPLASCLSPLTTLTAQTRIGIISFYAEATAVVGPRFGHIMLPHSTSKCIRTLKTRKTNGLCGLERLLFESSFSLCSSSSSSSCHIYTEASPSRAEQSVHCKLRKPRSLMNQSSLHTTHRLTIFNFNKQTRSISRMPSPQLLCNELLNDGACRSQLARVPSRSELAPVEVRLQGLLFRKGIDIGHPWVR